MQLTRLDRWLKERFIYETHIFTLRLPEGGLPSGVRVEEVEQKKSSDYKHRLISLPPGCEVVTASAHCQRQ